MISVIELYVYDSNIKVVKPETLTTGRLGHKIYVQFDSKWANITHKRASFKAGNILKIVRLPKNVDSAVFSIPVEVLISPGYDLEIAFKGFDNEISNILPTKYVRLGYIHQGGQILKQESIYMMNNPELYIASEEEIDEMLDDAFIKNSPTDENNNSNEP